jgi:hypothetical protein
MFNLLLYGLHRVDLPILWRWNLPLSQLWDWPCHQRVRFQPVPRILPRSQKSVMSGNVDDGGSFRFSGAEEEGGLRVLG